MAFSPFIKSVYGMFRRLVYCTYPPFTINGYGQNTSKEYYTRQPEGGKFDIRLMVGIMKIDMATLMALPVAQYPQYFTDNSYGVLFGMPILNSDGTDSGDCFCFEVANSSGYFYSRFTRRRTSDGSVLGRFNTHIGSVQLTNSSNAYLVMQPVVVNNREALTVQVVATGKGNDVNNLIFYSGTGSTIYTDDQTGRFCSLVPLTENVAHQEITDPNQQDPGGISGESGGEGDFDPSSDIITRPSISVINGLASANAGFITLYKITMPLLQLLASYLYTDNIWQIVSNYFSHPSDMIAGLLLVPVAVTTGQSYKPKVGLHTFEITLPIVTEQYYDIDMGNLTISEYYGSCFDYAPYTQIEIYLPFIGTRSLDVDEVMGKTLHLSYRIDVLNGDCVATISYYDGLNRSVRYEFSGNCGQQIPVSAQNMDAVVQNAIAFATTAVTAIAGAAGAGAAAASAATEAGATAAEIETISTAAQASANLSAAGDIAGAGVGAVMNSKAHIERTGNIGSGLGLLSVLTPYIVKKIPRQSLPDGYANFEGYPANIYGTLAEFSGYTVIDEIKLQNISATDGELAEIYNILKGGVYL